MGLNDTLGRRQFCQWIARGAAAGAASALAPAAMATSDQELIYMSAGTQIALFRQRRLSPLEVLNAQIKRIEAVGKRVNAITYPHFDEARAQATEAEKRYRRGNPRPLEGVTVALKDEYDKVGWITTAGSNLLADNRPQENHPAVDKLLAAGAVLHIQTTVPEMYCVAVTWSDLWGVTRNPWNLHYTTGGSSGGSAAALAAGMTTLATGSDMGGSIRIPAAFNGLYGFKPPYARNAPPASTVMMLPAVEGPLARSLGDLARLENVMVGPAPYTASSLLPAMQYPLAFQEIRGLRIAYSSNQGWAQIDPDVERNTRAALKVLESQGARVDEVDLKLGIGEAELRAAIIAALLNGEFGAEMADLQPHADKMTTYARTFIEFATKAIGPRSARDAAAAVRELYRKVQDAVFLKGYQALVMPTVATTNIKADFDPTRDQVVINGKEVDSQIGWLLTPLWNLLTWNPVVAVPTGLASNGVPTGMQVIATTYDDLTAFRVAAAYQRAAPPFFAANRFPDFRDQA